MNTLQTRPVSKTPSGLVDMAYPKPFTEMPVQPTVKKPGQLTEDQLKQFFNEVSRVRIYHFQSVCKSKKQKHSPQKMSYNNYYKSFISFFNVS